MNPQTIAAEESSTALPFFSINQVDQLANIVKAVAKDGYSKICVQITVNGRELYFHAGTNTTNENNDWVQRKYNVVKTFDHSSLYLKALWEHDPDAFYASYGYSKRDFAIVGGALPIIVSNVGIIGIIVISGLTDEEDHQVGIQSLKELKKTLSASK